MAAGVDASDCARLSAKLKGADRVIKRHVVGAIKASAQDSGETVIKDGSASMPSRGGLRDYLQSGGKVGIRLRSDGAFLTLTNRQGIQLAPLDKGDLRHPVFAGPRMSAASARKMASDLQAQSGGKFKYGVGRAASRIRNAGRVWVSQSVPAGTYTKAEEAQLSALKPKIERAVEAALRELA